MKIQLVMPDWSRTMQWVKPMQRVMSDGGDNEVVITANPEEGVASVFTWLDETCVAYTLSNPTAPCVAFARRYEVFSKWVNVVDWAKLNHVFFVNDALLTLAMPVIQGKTETSVLYNPVDVTAWSLSGRDGKNVAVVGGVSPRKNIPLAFQVVDRLADDYTLHFIGGVQCAETYLYIQHMAQAMRRRVYMHGQIPAEHIDTVLGVVNHLLCTSISEGSPNNVLEAMAKGIKPVVHNWPGAENQFSPYVFNSADEAANMIEYSTYNANEYREFVETNFDPTTTYRKVLDKLKCGIRS